MQQPLAPNMPSMHIDLSINQYVLLIIDYNECNKGIGMPNIIQIVLRIRIHVVSLSCEAIVVWKYKRH